MIELIRKILRLQSYQPLNKIEISERALKDNYKFLNKLNPNISIAPVLKSNAYGHGLSQIATVLDVLNPPFFCVDSIFEAYQLYKLKIKTPILIMGYVDPQNLKTKKLPFSYTVWDLEQVEAINRYQKGAGIHVFVDTGMNREGVGIKCKVKSKKCKVGANSCLLHFMQEIKQLPDIKIEGLMSHLASSGKEDPKPKEQLQNYQKALKICENLGIKPKWRHIAASGGLMNGYLKGTNLARVGRAIYGIELNDKFHLKGVLSLKTKIIQIKKLKKGSKIGYDGTYMAPKDITIAVLPIGYNDGVDRRLSNKGAVFVSASGRDSIKCSILGRISMNITTIDISHIDNPYIGQEVTVYSGNRTEPNSIEGSAKICETLPHDILVHLSSSVRRIIVRW